MKTASDSKTYFMTAAVLLVLLAATVGAAYINLGAFNPVMAMGIAALKAWLIIIIFMNVRRSGPLIWVAAAAGFFWLLLMFGLALSDFLTRH